MTYDVGVPPVTKFANGQSIYKEAYPNFNLHARPELVAPQLVISRVRDGRMPILQFET